MKVLLSIKPEFAVKIFNGTKKYEYRKILFKQPNVDTVVVYASYPTRAVLGEFKIDNILIDNIKTIWAKTEPYSGISEHYYRSYYSGKSVAIAIKIGQTKLYKHPLPLSDFNINYPPQSFCYLQ